VQKTFSITNFGCRASQSEGASIHQELLESHAVESESAYDANVVVVNSCTITAEADRDVRQTIRRIASRNPNAQIIVTGCYNARRRNWRRFHKCVLSWAIHTSRWPGSSH